MIATYVHIRNSGEHQLRNFPYFVTSKNPYQKYLIQGESRRLSPLITRIKAPVVFAKKVQP
jgi:hypothetical protein